jgi:hypothetical protein
MWINTDSDTLSIEKTFASQEDLESFKTIEDRVKGKTVKTYSSKEIQKKAHVTASQIKHWTMTGVIEPYKSVQGTGKMHTYDHQNLIEAMICRELSKYSINLNVMKDMLFFLRKKTWTFLFSWKIFNGLINTGSKRKLKPVSSSTMFDSIVKYLSIWDFFKIDQWKVNHNIFLVFWKDPLYLSTISETNKDEYCIDVAYNDLSFYTSRFSSLIIINLSILRDEAGDFFKEDSN